MFVRDFDGTDRLADIAGKEMVAVERWTNTGSTTRHPLPTPVGHSIRLAKLAKPRPDFPLFPLANGRWVKKVWQRPIYFGKWVDDPKGAAALKLWLDQKDDLPARRTHGIAIRTRLALAECPWISPRLVRYVYGL